MNFKLGFIAGTATGYSLARFLTADQKRSLEARVTGSGVGERVGQLAGSLRRNGSRVADTVVDRATGVVEATGERMTTALSPDDDHATSFGGADREPTAAEAAAAEKAAATVPDVGETWDEMARRGAETAGEGRVP